MKELKRQFFVGLKSAVKAGIVLGGGFLSYKLTGNWAISAPVAMFLAPILKVVDPSDNSMGFNLKK